MVHDGPSETAVKGLKILQTDMIHDVVRLRASFKSSIFQIKHLLVNGLNLVKADQKQAFVSLYLLGCLFIECSNRTDGGRLVLAMVE